MLTKQETRLVPRSYDIMGDILIFADFPKELVKKQDAVGKELLSRLRHVKVVCRKTRKYSGRFRLPKLRIIAGEKRKETIAKENKVLLKMDVEKVYFSERLAHERERICQSVRKNEVVLVMFAGVGPYSLEIAKNTKAKEVIAVEMNPVAVKYHLENNVLNRVEDVKVFKGDVRKIVPKLKKRFDRIVMPLPKGGEHFLDVALKAIKKKGVIHFYDFQHEGEFDKAVGKIDKVCKKLKRKYKILGIYPCGQYAPRMFRVCVDFRVV